ncbi:hypothetical protein NDU88_004701 [Pleurodeles waltl]|uniref:Uncharacterized protein n=1 Tax=Pleurodeles waltl TaxID=8319 RepID=A0AAV7PDB3_PLEWA|nr:hypothetical protein NDU88_004701 [Pleurodeles waltl]
MGKSADDGAEVGPPPQYLGGTTGRRSPSPGIEEDAVERAEKTTREDAEDSRRRSAEETTRREDTRDSRKMCVEETRSKDIDRSSKMSRREKWSREDRRRGDEGDEGQIPGG